MISLDTLWLNWDQLHLSVFDRFIPDALAPDSEDLVALMKH
jgi:hypothetical protein